MTHPQEPPSNQIGPRSIGAAVPRRGNALTRGIGSAVLAMLQWRVEGEFPNLSKMVMIGAPHTSNWDWVIGLAAAFRLGLRFSWIGKHVLFRAPFAGFFRWLGGVPVDRRAPHGVVQQIVDEFDQREAFLLGLAPEGTRKAVEKWRTGFYHIARGANVPILVVALDYECRVVRVGPTVLPDADVDVAMSRIQSLYADILRTDQI